MRYKILTLNDKVEWLEYILKLPVNQQDIYYTPAYYALFEKTGHGTAKCFVFEQLGKIALYPFLLNSVNSLGYELNLECFDIQGAYGYNGVVSNSFDLDFISEFKSAFIIYCNQANIVSEFIRFNPLLENNTCYSCNKPLHVNNVININLDVDQDDLWQKSYKNDVRRIIKKGIEAGYRDKTILIGEATDREIEDFIYVYYSTLQRNMADNFYYFTKEYFQQIRKIMPRNLVLSIAYLDNKPIGASTNFFMEQNAYGFFGGSLKSHQKISPFTFVTHCVNLKLMSLGVKNYLIGGGSEIDDNIFKYKRNFSKEGILKFYIGKNVHNDVIYQSIIQQWKDKHPESYKLNSNKILGYREI